jgi:hypothetical protein
VRREHLQRASIRFRFEVFVSNGQHADPAFSRRSDEVIVLRTGSVHLREHPDIRLGLAGRQPAIQVEFIGRVRGAETREQTMPEPVFPG